MSVTAIPTAIPVPRFVGGGRVEWGEKAVPEPGPGQLLVAARANALCGSERGQFFSGSPNTTPGHEAAGVVAAAGLDTRTPVGTSGVVFLMDFCGTCRSCRRGWTNLCLAKRGDVGFNRDGGYGPFLLVHESQFFAIPPDLPADEATLLLDIMGTGGHALGRGRAVTGGGIPDVLLVVGAGPIGLAVLAMARVLWGKDVPVYVSDVVPYRLGLVERLSGTPVDVKEAPLVDALSAAGAPAMLPLAVDTSGNAAARQGAVPLVDRGGALVCVGHGGDLALNASRDLIQRECTVTGSEYFPYADLAANLPLLLANREYLGRIVTHRFPVDQIQAAFEMFWSGETGKVVVTQGEA